MYSKIASRKIMTAAWRISLWSGLVFAIGTAVAFWFLQSFLANDIQSRADSWLTGELGVLADVAERTPGNHLHDVVVREVAELASREVPHDDAENAMNRAVFFVLTAPDGSLVLHTGAGSGEATLTAIQNSTVAPAKPATIQIPAFSIPFRVASSGLRQGGSIYLGLSTSYERHVLKRLRAEFALLWCCIILLGTAIVFVSTRRMLGRVQLISQTASQIGRGNLRSRVPAGKRNDEIAELSSTFNEMLDRIEGSVQQLHTMSDSLAHDLRSPLTSIRGKLELALMNDEQATKEDAIISSIEQLDRLSALLNTSLDVSEANADALRLRKEPIDLEDTTRSLIGLYEPVFIQAGLTLRLKSGGPTWIDADSSLIQRTITNLFDNELRHVRSGSTIDVTIRQQGGESLLLLEDDGEGFPTDILPRVLERYTKSSESEGHGLGLAFVAAVVRSHNGQVLATNRSQGGASILLAFPKSDG